MIVATGRPPAESDGRTHSFFSRTRKRRLDRVHNSLDGGHRFRGVDGLPVPGAAGIRVGRTLDGLAIGTLPEDVIGGVDLSYLAHGLGLVISADRNVPAGRDINREATFTKSEI